VRLGRSSRTIARESSAEPGRPDALSDPTAVTSRDAAAQTRALARAFAEETTSAAPTDATRLATMAGGSLIAGADGRSSVVFAAGGEQSAGPPRTTRTTRAATVQRALPEPAPAPPAIDVDELYEQIAARLRRELLLDRERAGELP
jgi:hypothetical protein